MPSAWSPITGNCCLPGRKGPNSLLAIGFWHWICEMITIRDKSLDTMRPHHWAGPSRARCWTAEEGKSNMSFWGYSREEEAYLGDKGRPVPQGEEGKRDCKGCASAGERIKKTREGWQAVWGHRQGDKQVALDKQPGYTCRTLFQQQQASWDPNTLNANPTRTALRCPEMWLSYLHVITLLQKQQCHFLRWGPIINSKPKH